MFVCVARLTLQIPESGSLKAKRQVLRRITDRVKARFNVAVAEVDDQDLWQKATLALAVVGNDRRHVDEQMEKIIHFVEEMYVAPLLSRQTEIMAFGDTLYSPGRPLPAARDEGEDEESEEFDEDGEEAGPEADLEELIAGMGRGDRTMAEAEGMADWESRPAGRESGRPAKGTERQGTLSLDEARARARSLRNPRDWEKK
ncbi:DUF503 domain-containing protein [Vitiosangium sp. GDMCC 1.1324]|uniref:DUF503 domain-containing protein n=1 Tax=Vitiosangium sp. (strain GDMCC 1.1324) TaxID=2138576 RepID=UPI000D3953A4|nr:DUF503 domain-containing protein [Vitiosangium sp. GDMCC 1.1324]PTL77894.1 DUF503 domain-containing protein [Vitiosangium sp. GDMCC 1.1324]